MTKRDNQPKDLRAKLRVRKLFRTMKFHSVYQIQKFQVKDKKDYSQSNNRGRNRIIPKDIARYNSISKNPRSK